MPDYSKISRPGLIPLKVENQGNLVTTQVNKINFVGAVTGSVGEFNDLTITIGISPTASFAISSSYALTASYLDNYIPPFPFTGSALITGSLGITGSLSTTNNVFLRGIINQTTPVSHVVTFDNTTGRLYITASSAFGGGGGGGSTPGGNTDTIQFNNAGVLDGSDNFKYGQWLVAHAARHAAQLAAPRLDANENHLQLVGVARPARWLYLVQWGCTNFFIF
jgi:hypothetical protein